MKDNSLICRVRDSIEYWEPFGKLFSGMVGVVIAGVTIWIAWEANRISSDIDKRATVNAQRAQWHANRAAQLERTLAILETVIEDEAFADLQRVSKQVDWEVREDERWPDGIYPPLKDWQDEGKKSELKLTGLKMRAEHAARHIAREKLRAPLMAMLGYAGRIRECLGTKTMDNPPPIAASVHDTMAPVRRLPDQELQLTEAVQPPPDLDYVCNKRLFHAMLGWPIHNVFIRLEPAFYCDGYLLNSAGGIIKNTEETIELLGEFAKEKNENISAYEFGPTGVTVSQELHEHICEIYRVSYDREEERQATDLASR